MYTGRTLLPVAPWSGAASDITVCNFLSGRERKLELALQLLEADKKSQLVIFNTIYLFFPGSGRKDAIRLQCECVWRPSTFW
jgi:hypothetical protein